MIVEDLLQIKILLPTGIFGMEVFLLRQFYAQVRLLDSPNDEIKKALIALVQALMSQSRKDKEKVLIILGQELERSANWLKQTMFKASVFGFFVSLLIVAIVVIIVAYRTNS